MNDFFLSREQVRELDRRATEEFGVPSIVLMENAGRGCAELLMRLNPERLPTVILCGPGNNGGDGFVIARHLSEECPIEVWVFVEPYLYTGDARTSSEAAYWSGIIFDAPRSDLPANCWVVDAMFGTGLSRGIEGWYAEAVEMVNASGLPVLAVDIPSGLDCDTGEPLGPTVRATHTATFVAPKLGFRNANAKAFTGEVHVIDIGAPRVLVDAYR